MHPNALTTTTTLDQHPTISPKAAAWWPFDELVNARAPASSTSRAAKARAWAERAFQRYGDGSMPPIGERMVRAIDADDPMLALEHAVALDAAVLVADPKVAEPVPAAWRELADDLDITPTSDVGVLKAALNKACTIEAAPVAREFIEHLALPIDDEQRRRRYSLADEGLPPVRAGSLYEATRATLTPNQPATKPREWRGTDELPQWLTATAQAFGLTFPPAHGSAATSVLESRRVQLIAHMDAAIAVVEDKSPGSLGARWLRTLRAHVAELRGKAIDARHGLWPGHALAACRALGVLPK